jgi:hypothetical protein
MPAGDKSATWSLDLESNVAEVSKRSAAELEQFRKGIDDATARLKEMSGSLRLLKGNSNEVAEARAKLKGRIEEERVAIGKANVEILRAGKNYVSLTDAAKKAAAEEDDQAKAAKKSADALKGEAAEGKHAEEAARGSGKAFEDVKNKLEDLSASLATAKGRAGLVVLSVGALAAGVTYLTGKLVESTLELGGWLLKASDAARSMGLVREATLGGAENSAHMGEQIDALARKVPTSREELSKLSVEIGKVMSGGSSRATGQNIVDTFNAVAEASSAMDESTGKAIEDILTRNQRLGRVSLSRFELQGKWNTGYEDISKALAKSMNISVDDAKNALAQGRVSLDAGAKAIRDAVETRFGEVNAKKLLSLDSISTKLHDDWVNLTKGVHLEPILESLKKVVDLFDVTHVEGYALKELFTSLGTDLGDGMQKGVPLVQLAVDEVILTLQELYIEFLENKKAVKETFGDLTDVKKWKGALDDAREVVHDIAVSVEFIAKHWNVIGKALEYGASGVAAAPLAAAHAGSGVGSWIAKKLGAETDVVDAGGRVIGSEPVRRVRGHAQGGTIPKPASGEVFVSAAPGEQIVPRGGSAGGAPGPAMNVSIPVNIQVDGSKGADDVAAKLAAPDFLAKLTHALREALVTAGVPTQTASAQ